MRVPSTPYNLNGLGLVRLKEYNVTAASATSPLSWHSTVVPKCPRVFLSPTVLSRGVVLAWPSRVVGFRLQDSSHCPRTATRFYEKCLHLQGMGGEVGGGGEGIVLGWRLPGAKMLREEKSSPPLNRGGQIS